MAGIEPFTIDIAPMPAGGWVLDMVTDPVPTPLLAAAGARGLATIDGLSMLVEQASASFMLLFGHEVPRQYDAELMGILKP
jgi:shikimate dehydrogenase